MIMAAAKSWVYSQDQGPSIDVSNKSRRAVPLNESEKKKQARIFLRVLIHVNVVEGRTGVSGSFFVRKSSIYLQHCTLPNLFIYRYSLISVLSGSDLSWRSVLGAVGLFISSGGNMLCGWHSSEKTINLIFVIDNIRKSILRAELGWFEFVQSMLLELIKYLLSKKKCKKF